MSYRSKRPMGAYGRANMVSPIRFCPSDLLSGTVSRRSSMDVKLNDSELKVMNVLWRRDETLARDVAAELTEAFGWNGLISDLSRTR